MSNRIVIIGASGFIGQRLYHFFNSKGYEVVGTGFKNIGESKLVPLDITDKSQLKFFSKTLKETDTLIWAAGNKDVNECEENPEKANLINSFSLQYFIEEVELIGIKPKILYISTDYVFSGFEGSYTEESPPNPTTVYGMSKYNGERVCLGYSGKRIVIRTGAVMGVGGNFFDFLLKNIKSSTQISLYTNLFYCPTPIEFFCYGMEKVILQKPENKDILHLSSGRRMSRFEFGDLLKQTLSSKLVIKQETFNNSQGLFPADVSLIRSHYFDKLMNSKSLESYFFSEVMLDNNS